MDSGEELTTKTCDSCRARKVRCVPDGEDATVCRGCRKGKLDCTFAYVLRKRGRKRGRTAGSAAKRQKTTPTSILANTVDLRDRTLPLPGPSYEASARPFIASPGDLGAQEDDTQPLASRWDSTLTLPDPSHNTVPIQVPVGEVPSTSVLPPFETNFSLAPVDASRPGPSHTQDEQDSPFEDLAGYIGPEMSMATHSTVSEGWDYPQINQARTPSQYRLPSGNCGVQANLASHDPPSVDNISLALPRTRPPPRSPTPQIEDLATWADISFFIGLYLQYQHSLMPLVHKPTFTNDIVMRKDRRDETFRALLLSLTAFVICQVPVHLIPSMYTQRQLEKLQHRCHVVSRAIQTRHLHAPNANVLVTIIADTYYCAATGRTYLKAALMGEVVRLIYTMRYHAADPPEDWNQIQTQLQRRIYWHLYCHEKTDAAMGATILMNDYEGVPPYPLETDDEFITSAGVLPQPLNRPSQMVGYVTNIRLFRHLSSCLLRKRLAKDDVDVLTPVPSDGWIWAETARRSVSYLLGHLPGFLRASTCPSDGSDRPDPFQTQRANILVSAALVEFALLDYQGTCRPEMDLSCERKTLGQKTYNMLASIKATHLASNGESMRSKVLSIIVNLLSTSTRASEVLHDDVREWWDMYCQVQFVQMIPTGAESLVPSRAPSPA